MSRNTNSSFSFHSSSSSSSSNNNNDDDNNKNNNNLDDRMVHQEEGLLKSSTSNSLNFLVAMLMYTFLLVLFIPTSTTAATVSVKNENKNGKGHDKAFPPPTHENLMTSPQLTVDRVESKLTTVNGFPSSSSLSSTVSESDRRFRDLNLIPNENDSNDKSQSQYSTSSSRATLASSSSGFSGQISRLLNWKRQRLGPVLGHRILRQTSQPMQHHEFPNSVYWHSKQKKGLSVISRLYPYIVGRDPQNVNRKEVSGLQQRSFVNEDNSPMVHMRRSSMISSSQRPYRFRLRWG